MCRYPNFIFTVMGGVSLESFALYQILESINAAAVLFYPGTKPDETSQTDKREEKRYQDSKR